MFPSILLSFDSVANAIAQHHCTLGCVEPHDLNQQHQGDMMPGFEEHGHAPLCPRSGDIRCAAPSAFIPAEDRRAVETFCIEYLASVLVAPHASRFEVALFARSRSQMRSVIQPLTPLTPDPFITCRFSSRSPCNAGVSMPILPVADVR